METVEGVVTMVVMRVAGMVEEVDVAVMESMKVVATATL